MSKTKGLTIASDHEGFKRTRKEESMIFAIKNDFIDDFCNLFIFFEYDAYAKIYIIADCENNTYNNRSIMGYIFKYDAINIFKYIKNGKFIKYTISGDYAVLVKNYSLMCLDFALKNYPVFVSDGKEIFTTLAKCKRLSFYQKKKIIKLLDNYCPSFNFLINGTENIVCLALKNEQYELALYLMQKCGCLLLHGNFHLKKLKTETQNDFYKKIKPYKDELYGCKTIINLILLAHKKDENSLFYHEKFPKDIIKIILNLFYKNRVEEIYKIKNTYYAK